MKMPLKKQNPSLLNILYFFLLFYFGNTAVSFLFLPSMMLSCYKNVVLNNKCIAGTFWALMLIVLIFFTIAWLRDPGYVYKRPNPNFVVNKNCY